MTAAAALEQSAGAEELLAGSRGEYLGTDALALSKPLGRELLPQE